MIKQTIFNWIINFVLFNVSGIRNNQTISFGRINFN
jgi:hypothetical protein